MNTIIIAVACTLHVASDTVVTTIPEICWYRLQVQCIVQIIVSLGGEQRRDNDGILGREKAGSPIR